MSVCDSANYIGTYTASVPIDPCDPSKSIGTYDSGGDGCGCNSACVEFCGSFTGKTATINPQYILTSGFLVGFFELFIEYEPALKGGYYTYFLNPKADIAASEKYLNVMVAQGGLNDWGKSTGIKYTPASDTGQISFDPTKGIVLNFLYSYDCYWKFNCHTK
jgi:hypothetical protein